MSHAKIRMRTQIANPDYGKVGREGGMRWHAHAGTAVICRSVGRSVGWLVQFLEYMCPGQREKEAAPPLGMDPRVCPRKIMGTYDDHDYGW